MALNYSKSFLSTQQEFVDGEREEFTPRQGGDAMIPSFFRPLSFIFQGFFFFILAAWMLERRDRAGLFEQQLPRCCCKCFMGSSSAFPAQMAPAVELGNAD